LNVWWSCRIFADTAQPKRMKEKIQIKTINDLSFISDISHKMRRKVGCIAVNHPEIVSQFSSDVYLDAATVILVLSGTGAVTVNYRSYPFGKNCLLLFSSSHLFRFEQCSSDISCLCLFVSREFMTEMDSTAMISQRVRYGVRLYSKPVLQLEPAHIATLFHRMLMVDHSMDHTTHYYYRDLVQNSLFGFFLDLSHIIECHPDLSNPEDTTRKESLVHSFIELLVTHYQSEHKVEFYASRLHVSTHYLTSIVKSVTQQSVSDFIFEMVYSEARVLLTHSRLSVQEIAMKLNFSDQSAFGKFFKRRNGSSPSAFRRLYGKSEGGG